MCGYPLDGPGYVVITETDVNHRHGDLYTQGSGPLHISCAAFACVACPFLRYCKSRRRVTGHSQRGRLLICGFDRYAVVFPPDPIVFMTFAHYDPTDAVQLTNQTHVAGLYQAAVNADTAIEFTTEPRLYWTDAADDLRRLNADWSEQWTTLQAWAQTSAVTINSHTYRGYALDQSRAGI